MKAECRRVLGFISGAVFGYLLMAAWPIWLGLIGSDNAAIFHWILGPSNALEIFMLNALYVHELIPIVDYTWVTLAMVQYGTYGYMIGSVERPRRRLYLFIGIVVFHIIAMQCDACIV